MTVKFTLQQAMMIILLNAEYTAWMKKQASSFGSPKPKTQLRANWLWRTEKSIHSLLKDMYTALIPATARLYGRSRFLLETDSIPVPEYALITV